MNSLPPPLVALEVDLRDFGFMPLDVLRLRDSDLAALATGEEFKAAVLLWCVAWHQVPAASLPKDDRLLARFSGAGPAWKKIREEALRGFVECSDGRYYHAVIAEKANESWRAKVAQRERTRAATEAREAKRRAEQEQRDALRNVPRDDQRNGIRSEQRDVVRDVHQGTGTVKGQGQGEVKAHSARDPVEIPDPPGSLADWANFLTRQGFENPKVHDTAMRAVLLRWVNAQVRLATVTEAIEAAKAKLGGLPNSPKYLIPLVEEILTTASQPVSNSPRRSIHDERAAIFTAFSTPSGNPERDITDLAERVD